MAMQSKPVTFNTVTQGAKSNPILINLSGSKTIQPKPQLTKEGAKAQEDLLAIQNMPQVDTGRKQAVTLPNSKGEYIVDKATMQAMIAPYTQQQPVGTIPSIQRQQLETQTQMGQQQAIALAQLQQQQGAEMAQLTAANKPKPQENATTRLAKAGMVPIGSIGTAIGNLLGQKITPEETQRRNNIIANEPFFRQLAVGIGYVSTIGVKGISLSTLFNNYAKNIDNLEKDGQDIYRTSTDLLQAAAIDKSIDPQTALLAMQNLNTALDLRYKDAEISLRKSPQDIASGLDLTDSLYRKKMALNTNIYKLQKYMVTGDPTEIIIATQQMTPNTISENQ